MSNPSLPRPRDPRANQSHSSLETLEPRLSLSAVVWTGSGGDSLWSNPANWSGGAVPNSSSEVVIDSLGPQLATVVLDAGPVTVRSLSLHERLIINRSVNLSASDFINLGPDADLRINGLLNWAAGSWEHDAQAVINPGGSLNIGRSSAPATGFVTLGTELLNRGYLAWRGGDINTTTTGAILNSASKALDMASPRSILGEGSLTNYGLIRRGGSASATTTIDVDFNNDDRVRILRGTLAIGANDPDQPSVINYGIFSGVSTTSTFLLRAPTLHRDAEFRPNARYIFSDSTHIFRNSITFANSTILASAQVYIDPGGAQFKGDVSIASTSLFLEGDLLIAGRATLDHASVDGHFNLNVAGTLTLTTASITSDLRILNTGRLISTGASSITADASSAGTLDIRSGSLTLDVNNAGSSGSFVNSGTILLGSTAALGVQGDLITTGTIDTTISSISFGKITSTGTMSLAGTLRARFTGAGFAPVRNFNILTSAAPRTGTFSSFVPLTIPAGRNASLLYSFNAATVRLA